jgi:hypothetical protein
VEPLTDSTSRLTIAVGFEGHGIDKILVPLLVGRQAQKEMPANLATLKRRIEAQQPQPGPYATSIIEAGTSGDLRSQRPARTSPAERRPVSGRDETPRHTHQRLSEPRGIGREGGSRAISLPARTTYSL